MTEKTDSRIVYGAGCSYWDDIENAGTMTTAVPFPCCPHCRGVLYEMPSEAIWMSAVDQYEASGHPGYRDLVEWMKGKCFRSYDHAQAARAQEERKKLN